MSATMEFKPPTPSVMATLMGLDDLSPLLPIQKKPRVLSEDYLQRVASVAVREKCTQRHSFWSSVKEQKEDNDIFRILETLKRGKNCTFPTKSPGTSDIGHGNSVKKDSSTDNFEILSSSQSQRKGFSGNRKLHGDRSRSMSRFLDKLDLKKSRSLVNFTVFHHPYMRGRPKSVKPDLINLDQDKSRKRIFAPLYCSGQERNQSVEADSVIQNEVENSTQAKNCLHDQCPVLLDRSYYLSSITQASLEADKGSQFVKSCLLNGEEELIEFKNCNSSVSFDQDLSSGFCENESIGSIISGSEPESFMSMKENFQHSPHSVLDPMYKQETVSFCFGTSLHGLQTQLAFLDSESLETNSEGSEVMVFRDGDFGDGSVCDSGFGDKESRDFSYLIDLLTEAGLRSENIHMSLDKWHSPEQPIGFSVFEILDKKYIVQDSWNRSERRLLFDCINLGLIQIMQQSSSLLSWEKPAAKRVSRSSDQGLLEEELWWVLLDQEKEANKETGQDLELGDDVRVICREIEDSLVDQFVADVISSQDFLESNSFRSSDSFLFCRATM